MQVHETVRFAAPKTMSGSILLIEDDLHVARGLMRVMNAEGYSVVHVGSGAAAVEKVMSRSFDAVISDLNLPGASGVDILNLVRAYDPDVPLVLMAGSPTMDTAIEAVSLGVLEYLVKPLSRERLVHVLARATKARRSAVHRREAANESELKAANAETVRPPSRANAIASMPAVSADPPSGPRVSLNAAFERALASLTVKLEPIADAKHRKLIGFAARMCSNEETLSSEAALVVAAEHLGRLEELRRLARGLAVKAYEAAPQDALLFIDVHPSDLLDGELYSPDPVLAKIADRIVLQVHARGLTMGDLSARASVLRFVGYRLALADLDAGRECLSQIVDLAPDFVKIDARLVRGVDSSAARLRLVTALISMCRSLEAISVAEGVSSAEECKALASVGCTMVQGALLARHAI